MPKTSFTTLASRTLAAAALLTVSSLASAQVAQLYWTEDFAPAVRTSDGNGVNVQTVVGGLQTPLAIDADAASQQLFFTDTGNVRRVNFDGTGLTNIVTSAFTNGQGIAVDSVNSKVWWSDWNTGDVKNSDFSGNNVQTAFTLTANIGGLDIDPINQKIYIARGDRIQSANFDGTGLFTIFQSSSNFNLLDVAVDVAGGKVYWTDPDQRMVRRADLSGANLQNLITTGVTSVIGIDLDLVNGKLYVADKGLGSVHSANLNGTGFQTIYSSQGSQAWGMAVVIPAPATAAPMLGGLLFACRRRR